MTIAEAWSAWLQRLPPEEAERQRAAMLRLTAPQRANRVPEAELVLRPGIIGIAEVVLP